MSFKRSWLCVAVVLFAVTALSVTQVHGRTAVPSRAVEAGLTQVNILGTLTTAMGERFGGAWYTSTDPRLHVGVVSPHDRKKVEEVAADAGVGDDLVTAPVRSTWAELLAAQEDLGRRLADLAAEAEVATSIQARSNSMEVELGPAVSPKRRTTIARAAAGAGINASVTVVPHSDLTLERDGKCKAFAPGEANCDPTITAGVGIKDSTGYTCTAGPVVFPQEHSKVTDTYILTAGHCMDPKKGRLGVGGSWFATTKEGEVKGLGKAVDFLNNSLADVGVIKVENSEWLNTGAIPADPALAIWTNVESTPAVVTGEQAVAEGAHVCMSGQTTGTSCGEVLNTSVEVGGTKGLVEVKAERAVGDSGGAWYVEASPGIVVGTHVGSKGGNAAFEPIYTSFEKLNTKLQLLTEGNKERHPFKFKTESVPVTIKSSTDGVNDVFKTTAGVMECSKTSYTGTVTEKESIEFTLTPSYSGCTATAGSSATVDVNECKYRFKVTKLESVTIRTGSFDVVCPEKKEMAITIRFLEVLKCTVDVPSQSGRGTVSFTNVGAGATREITIDLNLSKLTYAHTAGTGLGACTKGLAENGTLEGKTVLKAETGGGAQVGFYTS